MKTTAKGIDIERNVEIATEGLTMESYNMLDNRVTNKENALIICNYINSIRSEVNLSDNYRQDIIMLLSRFSIYFDNAILFKEITRGNILSYLDSKRKTQEADCLHRWIGTYNTYRMHLMRFFKWLYSPDIPPDNRPKPSIIQNIAQLKRKEKSIYKPTDLWIEEDDALFLKYCPNPRDKCYHAMARDSAARPIELLKLRIRDLVFRFTPDKKQYAEVLLNGKTGTRSIPLIDSIPYVKDWILHHPQSGNPNSIFLCGFGRSLNRMLQVTSLNTIYRNYKENYFPALLENPNVPPEDKQKIRELLKKKWNPYVRRHSSLTQLSTILKEHTLRQFAGWSPRSQMAERYLHYFGSESSNGILEARGLITKDNQLSTILRPKECPNCSESNKPDSRFCTKCRMVLTYDAYSETLEKEQAKDQQLDTMNQKYNELHSQIQVLSKNLFESGVLTKD
ncbi:MAG: hypothetical protein DLM72_02425 [Candidatus Nitrosopolaris wilkensis]|nr:MAG: hypothetical protein DLM72_02425 [Candidatus Nitrosopolaris wilkensis]